MLAGAGGAFDDDAEAGDVSVSRGFVVRASTVEEGSTVAEATTDGDVAGAACA